MDRRRRSRRTERDACRRALRRRLGACRLRLFRLENMAWTRRERADPTRLACDRRASDACHLAGSVPCCRVVSVAGRRPRRRRLRAEVGGRPPSCGRGLSLRLGVHGRARRTDPKGRLSPASATLSARPPRALRVPRPQLLDPLPCRGSLLPAARLARSSRKHPDTQAHAPRARRHRRARALCASYTADSSSSACSFSGG
jgi:hypothetical protein